MLVKAAANWEDFRIFFMVVLPYFGNEIITTTKATYARGLNSNSGSSIIYYEMLSKWIYKL